MADAAALIDAAIAELRQTTISGRAYFAKPGPGHWHNALDDLAAAKAAVTPPPPPPPPPPPASWPPAGATLADALNGRFDTSWLFEASDPQGGSSEVPFFSWADDGEGGKCLQYTMPPSASPTTSQSELISHFRGNGDAASRTAEGDDTLYQFDFRVPLDGNYIGGNWDWFCEQHNNTKIVPGTVSTAWRLVGSTGSNTSAPAPDAYIELRVAGGPSNAPVYTSFKTPLGVLPKGEWGPIKQRTKWGVDAAHGEVEAWVGDLRIAAASIPTLLYNAATGQRDNPAFGLYHYSYRKTYATKRQFRRVAVLPA